MWINSFVVKFKGLKKGGKGLNTYLSYLNDNNHPNHVKEGHEIVNFKNWKLTYQTLKEETEKRYLETMEKGKGGRPPTKYGQSITINLPFHLQDKQEQKEVSNKIINNFLTYLNKEYKLNMSKDDLIRYKKELLFYNLHIQPKGSMTQINIVMSEIFKGKKIDLSKKRNSFNLKMITNKILKQYGHDIEDYHNKQEKKKRPYSIQDHKTQQLENLLKREEQDHQETENELKRVREIREELEETLGELSKTVNIYLNRVKKGLEEENYHKVDRNLNLLEERLKKEGKEVKGLNEMIKEVKKGFDFGRK